MTDPAPEIPLPLPTDYVLDDPQHVAHHNKLSYEFNRMSASVIHEGSIRWDLSKHDVPTDGTTLADTAFDALLAQMKPGDTLDIPHGASIKLANRRNISKAITVEGNDSTILQSSTAGVFRVIGGGDGSQFKNVTGVGPSGTVYAADSRFIMVEGTVGAYVEDVKLENVVGINWANANFEANYARRVTTRDVLTKSCVYAGQMFISCEYLTLFNPMCDTLNGLGVGGVIDCYPIAFTRHSNKSLAAGPRTLTARVFGGWAKNTPWEALDTHAGVDIKVFGYNSYNTLVGVAFVGCPDESGVNTYAPIDCWAFGCESTSGVSDGSRRDGFIMTGALDREHAQGGGFVGCTTIGHGLQDNTVGSGGVRLHSTIGTHVSQLTAIECSPHGVAFGPNNYDATLSDILAIDPWSNDSVVSGAVGIAANNNTFSMSNVRLRRGTKVATNVARAGVRANSSGLTGIEIVDGGGNNFSAATDGAYVPSDTWVRESHFGVKSARQTLPAADVVTAANIRAALIGLGLAQ